MERGVQINSLKEESILCVACRVMSENTAAYECCVVILQQPHCGCVKSDEANHSGSSARSSALKMTPITSYRWSKYHLPHHLLDGKAVISPVLE